MKHLASKIFLSFSIFALSLCLSGCDKLVREELDALQDQIDALAERMDQLNENVNSLSEIVREIQNGGYVRTCTEIVEGGKTIGYRLTFSDGKEIVIYHGKDGQDGHTPIIGIRQDTDGEWYWTLDGEWLLNNGQKVKATGKDGAQGQDGVTPQLKIENDYWYVSTDNGQTWTRLSKAKGEDGDSFFQSVDVSNSEYISLTLADGTVIKIPTWAAFEALREKVNQMNTNLSSLQQIVTALQDNDYVQSVTPYYENGVQVGYTITFTKSGDVVIYYGKDGADGHTPVIGIRQDTDGEWYWTLDGEWLLNDGQKVKATGKDGQDAIAPQLKIENEYWYISTDGGQTWVQLGKAKGEDGQDGDSFFRSVDVSNPSRVILILADGTRLELNRFIAVSMQLTVHDEALIAPKEVLEIGYTLEGTVSEKTVVTASSDGNYKVKVAKVNQREGIIYVTCPEVYADGYINVMLYDGYGNSDVKVVNFIEREVTLSQGLEYTIGFEGGTIEIPVEYNFDYSLQLVDDAGNWITIVKTKAEMQSGTVQLNIAENPLTRERSGQINVVPADNSGFVYQTITVTQDSYFVPVESITLDQTSLTIFDGESVNLTATVWPNNATHPQLTWESSNSSVKVDQRGTVTGSLVWPMDSNASATITVSTNDGDCFADCLVTVIRPVSSISVIILMSSKLHVGERRIVNAMVYPNSAYNKDITWTSSDLSVAIVENSITSTTNTSHSNYIIGVGRGKAIITATANDGSGVTVSREIEVEQYVTDITLDQSSLSLVVGESSTLAVTSVLPEDANDKTYTWSSSDESVATVDVDGQVLAKSKGIAEIYATANDGSNVKGTCNVIVSNQCPDGAVDLGMTTTEGYKLYWAKSNLCESGLCANPEDYGDYYAWGEIEPYYSSQDPLIWKEEKTYGYTWESYSLCDGSPDAIIKYNTNSLYGPVDNVAYLELSDDVARQNLRGLWRMPLLREWSQLLSQCTWTWTTRNGKNGYLITSTNGNSIFLPAAGNLRDTNSQNMGSNGEYWSTALTRYYPIDAWCISFYSEKISTSGGLRCCGQSIRPVSE